MSRQALNSRRLLAAVPVAAISAGLLSACVATSPDTDARFGQATHQLLVQQRHDPDATQKNGQAQPPADGRSVRGARDSVESGGSSGGLQRGAGAILGGGGDR